VGSGNVSAFNTVVTHDLLEPYIRKDRPDAEHVRFGRIATVAGILVSILTALIASGYSNIITASSSPSWVWAPRTPTCTARPASRQPVGGHRLRVTAACFIAWALLRPLGRELADEPSADQEPGESDRFASQPGAEPLASN
jgi:hypothetical protein